jgi:hypothetical protein
VNIAVGRAGSIHDDANARRLGFRGGLVSGLVHNEQFPPLALEAFGRKWFERGSYSMYYRAPTLDHEPVRAFMRDPGLDAADVQVEAWSETEGGVHVAEGTISCGEVAEPSALQVRLTQQRHSGELRILRPFEPGTSLGEPRTVQWTLERQLEQRDNIAEPLEWYFGPSPWGRPICASLALYRLLRPRAVEEFVVDHAAVQVDGGIEVQYVQGPVLLDTEYLLEGRACAAGRTPKTEYLWFESSLSDLDDGHVVARKLMMCRWLKASSALYRED